MYWRHAPSSDFDRRVYSTPRQRDAPNTHRHEEKQNTSLEETIAQEDKHEIKRNKINPQEETCTNVDRNTQNTDQQETVK